MIVEEYQRSHVRLIFERVSTPSHMRIVAITGPRQVGKTTIAHQVRKLLTESGIPCWYMPMDNLSSGKSDWLGLNKRLGGKPIASQPKQQDLLDIWESARRASTSSKLGLVLILDEIQIVSRWSNIVKGLWDADKVEGYPLRIVILGSAAWRMLVGRNEGLVGRFDSVRVNHWSFREMAEVFGLTADEFLFYGGYPGPFSETWGTTRLSGWQNYIANSILAPVIDRDIMGLKRIRKPSLMRQLIDLAPRYSGQVISYNKLLGQLQDAGNTTTIVDYLDLLSDAGLIASLTRYSSAPYLSKSSSPKLVVLNTALMTALSGYSVQEAQSDRPFWGRVVESAVGAHLCNTRGPVTRIHFWRDRSGQYEVDFVIERGPHLVGVEVKSGNVRSRRGLDAFRSRFPKAKAMVVGPMGIPLDNFFSRTAEEWIESL